MAKSKLPDILAFIHRELWINVNEAEIPGKQYQSFANAFAYLDSIAGTPDEPSQFNRWAIRFNGIFNDTIDVPEFVHLVGDGRNTSGIMGGVNFLGDGGSVVSSISAYNCLLNIDQKDNGGGGSPVMINTNEIQEYKPSEFYFRFSQLPTSGSYGIDFFGTTINFPFNSTAIDIENSIRSILPKYANITVSGDYTTRFTIYLDGLPFDTNSGISIVNISLNVFSVKSGFAVGQSQIQQFVFSATPTDGSFKVRFKRSDLGYTRDSNPIDWSIDAGSFSTQMLLFAQAIQADIGGDIGNWSGDRPNATTFQINFMGYGGWIEMLEVIDNTLTYGTPGPGGQGADISLYNCAIFDAKTETASTLRMFDTDIYQGDFSGFDVVTIKGGKAHSNIGIIFLTPINNVRIDDCDLQTYGEIYINNGELLNCRLAGEKLFIYGKNSIKQCILDIKYIKLIKGDNLNLIQTDGNGVEIVVNPGANLNIYGTSQINVINQRGDVNTYGDYYDNTISGLSATDEKTAIDELSVMMNNLIDMATPMTGDGSPIDNAVEPRYIGDRYIDNLGPTVYTAYNTTFNDRIS